jgi:hypothetical protein
MDSEFVILRVRQMFGQYGRTSDDFLIVVTFVSKVISSVRGCISISHSLTCGVVSVLVYSFVNKQTVSKQTNKNKTKNVQSGNLTSELRVVT